MWLAFAGVLFLIEVSVPGFGGFLIAAVAALLVSVLTAFLAPSLMIQIALFALLSVVGAAVLWRWSNRKRSPIESLTAPSDRAEVIAAFDERGLGRVRWQGQSWAAESLEAVPRLAPGDAVVVMRRVGTRLEVLPVDP